MSLTPAQRQQLLRFIGFGAPERMRYVFVGEKEYTPADTQLDNCEIRAASFTSPWEDKNEALRHLARGFASRGQPKVANEFLSALSPGRYFSWQGGAPGSVGVWTWAALVVTAWRDSAPCSANGRWFRSWAPEYEELATVDSDVALTELYPLPMRSVTHWPTDYQREFGFADAHTYFQAVFPIRGTSARRTLLENDVLARLPREAIAVGYGRGGRGAEFWQRYDALFAPRSSNFNHRSAKWHSIVENRIEIGISGRGHLIARVGFPWGRPNANPVTQEHVPALVESLRSLRAQNP